MENDDSIQQPLGLEKWFAYCIVTVGALLTMRQQTDHPSPKPQYLDLSTPEGRKIGLDALRAFAALMKLAMDEWEKPGSPRPMPPWAM
jgi:hypothetical protein